MKRIIALLLTLIMVLSSASVVMADEVNTSGTLSFTSLHPLYEGELEEYTDDLEYDGPAISTYATGDYTSDKNAVVSAVRKAMVERKSSCSIKYKSSSMISDAWFEDLLSRVLAETGNPKEGDYLAAHYKSIHLGGSYTYSRGTYYNDIVFTFGYRTSAAQEAVVDSLIPAILKQIGFKSWMTDYEKIKVIYDYVRWNVVYDYEHNDNYDLKYSAYAALVNGTAVCNGYAALFYRLAKAAGFDVRIVTGVSNGEGHAWNLIRLGNKYYYVDPTWDSGITYTVYFMKGYNDFPNHTPYSDFISSYNISPKAYDISSENSAVRGSCGPYARWVLLNDKTLIIYGTAIANDMSGFAVHSDKIKEIYVYDTVTGISGNISFNGFTALEFISVARQDFLWGIDDPYDVPEGVRLIGHTGTAMHNFANKYGYPFEQYAANPFVDVEEADYFFKPVAWAVKGQITSGVTENTFCPNDPCTRGQIVAFLWRAAGRPEPNSSYNPFVDVKNGDYYYKAVLWAVEKEITAGVTPNRFGADETCTRAQAVSFLWRAAGRPESLNESNPFVDVSYEQYYYQPVLWAVEEGITAGISPYEFGPENNCTRGQIVSFIYRDANRG